MRTGLNSGEAPPDSFPRGSKVGRGGTAQLGPSSRLPGLGGGPGGVSRLAVDLAVPQSGLIPWHTYSRLWTSAPSAAMGG